jgi:type VI secretion system secreted protein Hcp
MAGQVFLTVYNQGNAFEHSVIFDRGDPASWVHEFEHQVLYLGDKLFFDRSPIRVHKPVRLLVPIDKVTPQLIQLVVQGATVEKVMLRWFQYQEKTKSDTEYFRHLFETVAFEKVRLVFLNVKDPLFELYDHAVELAFRYKRATWTYMQGNLIVSDEWQSLLSEDGEAEEEAEPETYEELVEEPQEEASEDNAKKVKLSDAKFLPEEGKTDFNKECNVTVNIEYLAETNRKKVLFKLFSVYNNNPQDMQHEIEVFESGGKADAALTLHYNDEYYSDTAKTADATVEYFVKISHPEGDEIESERLKLPFKKQQTVQFIEIPDVLFNHNSAVPCIDINETLVGAMVSALIYAHNNPDKEIVIYGHTDSSGETDYNLELSELRSKSIKALLDNDSSGFVNVCNDKYEVEDYQTILTALTKTYSWDCDPGAVDNQNGPKTEGALKNFQIDYNLFYEQSIGEDGKIGKQTWGALFNVIRDIIWGIASKETGDTIPTLKYGKGGSGINPCGEKYAQDAYAKKGRKSKSDRRVEIVFSDPSEPIEDTPYVDTIVMEPIAVVVAPEKKIKGFTMQCQHDETVGKKKIKRKAKNDQVLEVVADKILGDKVDFSVLPENAQFPVSWSLKGHQRADKKGEKVEISVNGISEQVLSKWQDLFDKAVRELIPPKVIRVIASDDAGGSVSGSIKVFNGFQHTFDLDLSTKWKAVFEIIDTIISGCNFLGEKDKLVEIKKFKGKLSFACGWKEDIYSNKVFFAWGLTGGFDPLFGLECNIPIPIKGIASKLPQQLLDYGVNVDLVFTLGGGIGISVAIEQESPKGTKGTGKGTGSITGSLGGRVRVFNGKLLRIDAKLGTGIEGSVYIVCHAKNDLKEFAVNWNAEVKWNGIKGGIEWQILDGKLSGKHEVTLVEEKKLWSRNDDPQPLLEWKHA